MSTAIAQAESTSHPGEGLRETIDSIVIALILAFVFRAFIVEAFVIPTGSMAPTLYGAHGTIVCADCGTEFAYGLRDLDDQRRTASVSSNASAICPNCNNPNSNLEINDITMNPETGDRILVLKWPFDAGGSLLGPKRWDVVVFKDPADGKTNFIKRLAGMPNEVLMILDGDVYSTPTSSVSQEALKELDDIRHEKYLLRTGRKRGTLREVPPAVLAELDRKMTLARKSPEAQEALWFVVYDNDFPPSTRDANQPRWEPAAGAKSGWNTAGRRIRFEDAGAPNDSITLIGKSIRAECAYNVHARSAPPPVSDLRVRFVLTPSRESGSLNISLGKARQSFNATIRMDGLITLRGISAERGSGPGLEISTQLEPFAPGVAVEVSVENVDYRVAVRIRGKEVIATSSDPASESYYGPDLAWLRSLRTPWPASSPRISAEGTALDISHLLVEHDAYYYLDNSSGRSLGLSWAPRDGWAGPQSPILLREDEYFMLGDNTAASKDSRLWDTVDARFLSRQEGFQLGTVPRDQLIGKAFFVYWPSPNRVSWLGWLPLVKGAVIPDVGRMRWIR